LSHLRKGGGTFVTLGQKKGCELERQSRRETLLETRGKWSFGGGGTRKCRDGAHGKEPFKKGSST